MILTVLCAVGTAQAQGTITYVSNLSRSSGGAYAVGNDSWFANSFRTGANAEGYSIDSIQLLLQSSSGSPSNFSVLIYDVNGVFPGTSIGTLSGPDPIGGGIFTFESPGISLAPSTLYFLVLTSGTPVANGAYYWSYANTISFNSTDGWTMGPYSAQGNGTVWGRSGGPFQFAINATPVPEPSSSLLLLIGGIFFLVRQRQEGTAFWSGVDKPSVGAEAISSDYFFGRRKIRIL